MLSKIPHLIHRCYSRFQKRPVHPHHPTVPEAVYRAVSPHPAPYHWPDQTKPAHLQALPAAMKYQAYSQIRCDIFRSPHYTWPDCHSSVRQISWRSSHQYPGHPPNNATPVCKTSPVLWFSSQYRPLFSDQSERQARFCQNHYCSSCSRSLSYCSDSYCSGSYASSSTSAFK